MPSLVIRNFNSFATLAQAASYLDDSTRATAWAALDPDSQARALITATRILNKQCWEGEKTGVSVAESVAITAGGTGYAAGAILTGVGGTFGEAVQVTVLAVSSGAVTSVELLNAGTYSAVPTNPVATTSSGAGTGCTLTLITTDQTLDFPLDGDLVIPDDITFGCIELAFELSQNADLETEMSTASNVKSVAAGSAKVEFFRVGGAAGITAQTRFPAIVQEYVGAYLCGASGGSAGGFASGTCEPSSFDRCDRYGPLGGLS